MGVKLRKSIVLLLTVCLGLSFAVFEAKAASYPDVFFFSDADFQNQIVRDTVTLGSNYPLRMYWFAVNNNEGYDISIYDDSGNVVATAAKTWTNSGYTRKIIVNWNTANCRPGSYKVVVTLKFYSFYRWNEAPTKRT